jgi:NADH-quinone oxidoreductase subunit E/NADP-reducing hydrogenase subunit HndA
MESTLGKIIEEYQGKPGEIISVLEKIQEVYGYLPQEVLKEVSEKLQVHLSQLFSLATFYSAFTLKPRGEHIVHVCLGTACHVRGAPKIVDELSRLLGIKPSDTTEDMKFTLETVRCIGCCSLAPVLKVGKDIYGYNTMDKMPKILANYKG